MLIVLSLHKFMFIIFPLQVVLIVYSFKIKVKKRWEILEIYELKLDSMTQTSDKTLSQ